MDFFWAGNESLLHIERNLTSGGYVEGPAFRSFDDSGWRGVGIPHDFIPIIITEASSSLRTRGTYITDNALKRLSPDDSGAQSSAEDQWSLVAQHDYLSGLFIWTGFDYRGEPIPYDWPALDSNFGVMDLCGFPKDNYFYYQAAWTKEPVVHIFPHWNWPDRIGQAMALSCHSNCDEVELILNGRSLGRRKTVPGRRTDWKGIPYEPGRVEARGYREGALAASTTVETTGAPKSICLNAWRRCVPQGDSRIIVVTASIVDERGKVVPTADNLLSFLVEGAGILVGVGNGDPGDHGNEKVPFRRAFSGLCQAILKTQGTAGTIGLSAASPGLMQGKLIIRPYRI